MSNKIFFNQFFNKNKVWSQIQTNPIAHQDLWQNYNPRRIRYYLTNSQGGILDGAYDSNIQFPGLAAPTRVRIPNNSSHWFFQASRPVETIPDAHSVVRREGGILPFAFGLPDPTIDAASLNANVNALVAAGRFVVKPFDYGSGYNHQWTAQKDYWFPNYQGDFMKLTEKSVQKRASPSYNKDASLIPKKYISNKQKEAFMWMIAGNRLFNI